jgi:hypothetical protein
MQTLTQTLNRSMDACWRVHFAQRKLATLRQRGASRESLRSQLVVVRQRRAEHRALAAESAEFLAVVRAND